MDKAVVAKRPYEIMFICSTQVPQSDVDGLTEKIKKILADANAELQGVQPWGRRRLAYPIKQHRDGLYIYVEFKSDPSPIPKLNELLRVSDLVIRHMVVRKEDTKAHRPKPGSESVKENKGLETPSSTESKPVTSPSSK